MVIVCPLQTPRSILKKSKKNLVFDTEESPSSKQLKLEIPSTAYTASEVTNDDFLIEINDSRNDNLTKTVDSKHNIENTTEKEEF